MREVRSLLEEMIDLSLLSSLIFANKTAYNVMTRRISENNSIQLYCTRLRKSKGSEKRYFLLKESSAVS